MNNDTLARTLGIEGSAARYYVEGPQSLAGDVSWRVRDRKKESPARAVFVGENSEYFARQHCRRLNDTDLFIKRSQVTLEEEAVVAQRDATSESE